MISPDVTAPANAKKLLAELYPGEEPIITDLRDQLLEAAFSPGLTTALLEGPPSSGKTTMARALAMARMFARVSPILHNKTIESAAREVRAGKPPLRWYRDISLAGLTDNLAEMQLFGIGPGKATGVEPSIGIFEQAMTGCLDRKAAKKKHTELYEDHIAQVTGGVVLLDEIGDLSNVLQAKLLRTLNEEVQYRVGMEGMDDYGFKFRGLAILATWRDIDLEGIIREDLRQRICQHRIVVPPLSRYSKELRREVISSTIKRLQDEYIDEFNEASFTEDQTGEPKEHSLEMFHPEWKKNLVYLSKVKLKDRDIWKLAEADWSKLGEFRGLRAVLRRILTGVPLDKALTKSLLGLEKRTVREGYATREQIPASIVKDELEMQRYIIKGVSLSEAWKGQRLKWANEILKRLGKNSWQLMRLLEETAKEPKKFKKELLNMLRSKKR